jgi:hypothetical protein
LTQSKAYQDKIPTYILTEFLSRRQRNQNILIELVNRFASTKKLGHPLFEKLYITLDDNALYGFNIAEADYLRQLVRELRMD